MKIRNILLLSIVAVLPTSLSADSFLSENGVKYRVKQMGPSSAARVCTAVVRDEPDTLDKIFRQDLRNNIYRYSFNVHSRAIQGSYTCNDLALLPFADQIGAIKVSSYLRNPRGKVTMEELVSSID